MTSVKQLQRTLPFAWQLLQKEVSPQHQSRGFRRSPTLGGGHPWGVPAAADHSQLYSCQGQTTPCILPWTWTGYTLTHQPVCSVSVSAAALILTSSAFSPASLPEEHNSRWMPITKSPWIKQPYTIKTAGSSQHLILDLIRLQVPPLLTFALFKQHMETREAHPQQAWHFFTLQRQNDCQTLPWHEKRHRDAN